MTSPFLSTRFSLEQIKGSAVDGTVLLAVLMAGDSEINEFFLAMGITETAHVYVLKKKLKMLQQRHGPTKHLLSTK